MKKIITKITLVALVLSVTACSSTPVRRSFKESWNDTMTASKVRYKLMKDKEVHKGRMHVEVYRGQVTLTGRALSDAERARAETLAKSVKKVTGVDNYVHVIDTSSVPAAVAVAKTPSKGGIKEKVIAKEEIKEEIIVTESVPAIVPTIRESTGQPARVAADRKLADVKKTAAKPAAVAAVKAKHDDDKPAAVRTAPAEPSRVVGKATTGLPWDGEIYEDDASKVTPSPAPKAVTATRTPVITVPSQSPSVQPTDDLAREAAQELEKLRSKR